MVKVGKLRIELQQSFLTSGKGCLFDGHSENGVPKINNETVAVLSIVTTTNGAAPSTTVWPSIPRV
jgi:hypothetical protein